ncbi:hypothetical protein M8818_006281 [Zalaria obscura]|uniref:Uncharacterized protein n=1 Tax=Zalaria obscura TaxID=2024903 RepID=A0ACC3S844_9PEZI
MPAFPDNLKPATDGASILHKERLGSHLPVQELARHLFDRTDFLSRQERILKIVGNEPLFRKDRQLNLSRPERYHLGLARAKLLRRLSVKHSWTRDDDEMAVYLVDDVSPYMLQMSMFVTTVREQGDEAQRAYWLPKIEKWEIIGAYAQTELGHGSNVRGLELQARWDPESKGFVLNSPTLTASKWWNGSMGRTANHAIVVAQLYLPELSTSDGSTQYKSYGPHPFMVQIRDMKTHQPLEGIVVGDIGPKYGYAPMDNGYMLFNNHHIPHSAMLARYNKVDQATGRYQKAGNPAVVYGTLTAIRANIVMHARLVLARAVTVAVRYTAVRHQFRDRDGDDKGPELPVLDYPTVQIRILPLLASAFALHYTGEAMHDLYRRTRAKVESGDFTKLAELHSTSSGLKSLCTEIAADGIETCRRALGGHGFGGGSGLIQLNNDYVSKPTVEGDNWMITQQTASYLIKQMQAAATGKGAAKSSLEEACREHLLHRHAFAPLDVLHSDTDVVEAFRRRALDMAYKAYRARVVEKKAWNSLLVQLHKLSRAFSQSLLVGSFYDALACNDNMSPGLREIMWRLFRLFALSTMDAAAREFSTARAVADHDLDLLPGRVQALMTEIRPHAVNLVDAWSIPDFLLDSALGRYDGRVYEDLFNRAHRLNPLNEVTFNPDYSTAEIVMGRKGEGIDKIVAKL